MRLWTLLGLVAACSPPGPPVAIAGLNPASDHGVQACVVYYWQESQGFMEGVRYESAEKTVDIDPDGHPSYRGSSCAGPGQFGGSSAPFPDGGSLSIGSGTYPASLTAYDAAGNERWTSQFCSRVVAIFVVSGDDLFVGGADTAAVGRYSVSDGTEHWCVRVP